MVPYPSGTCGNPGWVPQNRESVMSQIGTDAGETINATENVVYARDGNDTVFSSQASPDLYGGEGSDFLGSNNNGDTDSYGGDGLDTIHGDTVADQLYGDDGNDLIVGG